MNQKPRVLVSDKLSEVSLKIFEERGVDVDYQPGLGKNIDELHSVIHKYDGLAVRSATKVTNRIEAMTDRKRSLGGFRKLPVADGIAGAGRCRASAISIMRRGRKRGIVPGQDGRYRQAIR